eukprot:jgi/Chlat1/7918/Chrsp68S07355
MAARVATVVVVVAVVLLTTSFASCSASSSSSSSSFASTSVAAQIGRWFLRGNPIAADTQSLSPQPNNDTASPHRRSLLATDCRAGDTLALKSYGTNSPSGPGTPVSSFAYSNVGGSGTYNSVVNMQSAPVWPPPCALPSAASCVKAPRVSKGVLAPFHEEQSMHFRGPLELYNLAVYYPNGQGSWKRVSNFDRCSQSNMGFLNNKGGGPSGVYTVCGGSSQSWASADGKQPEKSNTRFSGSLAADVEVNAMTGQACTGSACGFFRGVGQRGWAGNAKGEKMFVLRLRMPKAGGTDTPAVWLLNAQVPRSAQYGCNCRGMGGDGGCGELDIMEVLTDPSRKSQCISQIYSFKGSTGTGAHYFIRPVNKAVTVFVVFGADGMVKISTAGADSFGFPRYVQQNAISRQFFARTQASVIF